MNCQDLLRKLEWKGEHGACLICLACRNCGDLDHREGCELAAALKPLVAGSPILTGDSIKIEETTIHAEPRRHDWWEDFDGMTCDACEIVCENDEAMDNAGWCPGEKKKA